MLLEVLVYLQDDKVAPTAMKLLKDAPTQEEQLEYVRSLRMLKTGWTPELRQQYFTWFLKAAKYKGGTSFGNFLRLIKADAIANLTDAGESRTEGDLEREPGYVAVAGGAGTAVREGIQDR